MAQPSAKVFRGRQGLSQLCQQRQHTPAPRRPTLWPSVASHLGPFEGASMTSWNDMRHQFCPAHPPAAHCPGLHRRQPKLTRCGSRHTQQLHAVAIAHPAGTNGTARWVAQHAAHRMQLTYANARPVRVQPSVHMISMWVAGCCWLRTCKAAHADLTPIPARGPAHGCHADARVTLRVARKCR